MHSIKEIVERLCLIGEREAALHVTLLREFALEQPDTRNRRSVRPFAGALKGDLRSFRVVIRPGI